MAKRGKKMSILTFKGGVHPYDGKESSKDVYKRQGGQMVKKMIEAQEKQMSGK